MPSIPLHPPASPPLDRTAQNPLPSLLQTPLGLALVEIQGSLHIPDQLEAENEPQRIGRIEFPLLLSSEQNGTEEGPWMKQVYFYVGDRQRLTGEVKRLDKPVGVMKKRANTNTSDEELEIVEIIRWKLYFGNRPEFV